MGLAWWRRRLAWRRVGLARRRVARAARLGLGRSRTGGRRDRGVLLWLSVWLREWLSLRVWVFDVPLHRLRIRLRLFALRLRLWLRLRRIRLSGGLLRLGLLNAFKAGRDDASERGHPVPWSRSPLLRGSGCRPAHRHPLPDSSCCRNRRRRPLPLRQWRRPHRRRGGSCAAPPRHSSWA